MGEVAEPRDRTEASAYWLVAMTIGAVALTLRRCGVRRVEGVALVVAYASFVALIVALVA